jgi:hypothetical protein
MPRHRDPPRSSVGRRDVQDDVVSLLRQIQELTLRSRQLRRKRANARELAETERARDQLLWRLAAAARRAAMRDSGAAA